MILTPEILGAAAVGFLVIIGAIGRYMQTRNGAPNTSLPAQAVITVAHSEMVIQLRRVADILDGMRALLPIVQEFADGVHKVSEVLGPELKKSADAQARIASERDARLLDQITELRDQVSILNEPKPRRTRRT